MPGQERAAAKAPGDRDSGTYNHKPKGRQKAARNSNIALHSITHTYRMERIPGIEPRYKREGLPYSYHINKDTKEKIASGLKVTIRQKQKTPAPACHSAGFSVFHRGLCRLTDLFPAALLPSPDIPPPREALSPHHHGTPLPTEVRPCIWEPRVHVHGPTRPKVHN